MHMLWALGGSSVQQRVHFRNRQYAPNGTVHLTISLRFCFTRSGTSLLRDVVEFSRSPSPAQANTFQDLSLCSLLPT